MPGSPAGLITNVLLIIMIILLGAQVVKIIQRRSKSKGRIKLKKVFYIPSVILLIGILYTFSPFKLDSQKLENHVVLEGHYEGSVEHATIRFRENKTFEIEWKMDNGEHEWFTGDYRKFKDTFVLVYNEKDPSKFGSIILNKDNSLISLDKPKRTTPYYVLFTVGPLKAAHEN